MQTEIRKKNPFSYLKIDPCDACSLSSQKVNAARSVWTTAGEKLQVAPASFCFIPGGAAAPLDCDPRLDKLAAHATLKLPCVLVRNSVDKRKSRSSTHISHW